MNQPIYVVISRQTRKQRIWNKNPVRPFVLLGQPVSRGGSFLDQQNRYQYNGRTVHSIVHSKKTNEATTTTSRTSRLTVFQKPRQSQSTSELRPCLLFRISLLTLAILVSSELQDLADSLHHQGRWRLRNLVAVVLLWTLGNRPKCLPLRGESNESLHCCLRLCI